MVPTKYIHEPWKMPVDVQESSMCVIDENYPSPIVDEVSSRKEGVKKSICCKVHERIENSKQNRFTETR